MQLIPIESNSVARPAKVGRPVRLEAGAFHLVSATGDEDAAAIARWMGDPTLCAALGRQPKPMELHTARSYIERFDRLLAHLLMIRRNSDGVAIGMMIVHIDAANRLAWMDAGIGERGAEDTQIALAMAARSTLAWLFEGIGLHKACAHVAEDNRRTAAWLAQRFTLEATLREEVRLPDGTRRTVLRYGLLRSEWAAAKDAFQKHDADGMTHAVPKTSRPSSPEKA